MTKPKRRASPERKGTSNGREPLPYELADAKALLLAGDVMGAMDLGAFPDIASEEPRSQAIMCMAACGMSQTYIAKVFDVSQPTINGIIKRIDPNGMFTIDRAGKNAFITKMAQGRTVEAMASITPEKLEESSARELTAIAKDMVSIDQTLNQTKHKEMAGSRLDNLLAEVAEEASFEVLDSTKEDE